MNFTIDRPREKCTNCTDGVQRSDQGFAFRCGSCMGTGVVYDGTALMVRSIRAEMTEIVEEIRMLEFKQYRRKQIAELRPYEQGEDMTQISVAAVDKEAGSPKGGDMIARNPKNHDDKWLVAAQYFADNFEPIE